MCRFLCWVTLFVCFHHVASGQILVVDKAELKGDSSQILGNLNVSFKLNNQGTTANEQVLYRGLDGTSDLVFLTGENAYILLSKINYIKSTGGPLVSTGYTHLRANFLSANVVSYETFGQLQYDNGRRMPFRLLLGGGFKFRLIPEKRGSLFLGIGGMHETERWKVTENSDPIEKNIWKTTNYVSAKLPFNDHFKLNFIVYYQGGYDFGSEVFRNRVSGDLVFSAKVNDRISFTTSFVAQYEDKPIIDIGKTIFSLSNGLSLKF